MPRNPKHPSLLARRNQVSTATELAVIDPDDVEIPDPPTNYRETKDGEPIEVPWHPNALETWREVWSSPMVSEFMEADYGGIRILLALEDDFWRKLQSGRSVTEQAAEISRLRKSYGLAPMGRRSLQWTIAQTRETLDRSSRRPLRVAATQGDIVEGSLVPALPSGENQEDLLGALE